MGLVRTERRGGAAIITYANPPRGTMTAGGSVEMFTATEAAIGDPDVRCIIFTGGLPDIFIRHYDVGELTLRGPSARRPWLGAPALSCPFLVPLLDCRAGFRPPRPDRSGGRPVLAGHRRHQRAWTWAKNSNWLGQGDIRIAGRTAVTAIGLPETRVGTSFSLSGGGTQRLPRVIGEAKALEMILRGLVVNGEQALELGLVHEAADDPLARALEIAAEFAARPPEGLAYAKRLTRAALDRPLSEGLADERRSFGAVVQLPSAIAAMRASLSGDPIERQGT